MFKKIKNSNMYSILILVAILVFCCIFSSKNQLYIEGLTESTSNKLKDNIYHSGSAHDSPAPSPAPSTQPSVKSPAPSPAPVKSPAPVQSPAPSPAVYPTCKAYQGTVWAFCGDKPTHRWGIGPEGKEKAISNCNYAASNQKKWGACK